MERTSGLRTRGAVTFRSYLRAMVRCSIHFRWAFSPNPSCLMGRVSGCRTGTRIRFPELVFTNPLFFEISKGTNEQKFCAFCASWRCTHDSSQKMGAWNRLPYHTLHL